MIHCGTQVLMQVDQCHCRTTRVSKRRYGQNGDLKMTSSIWGQNLCCSLQFKKQDQGHVPSPLYDRRPCLHE